MTELEFERLVREHQGMVCAVAYAVLRDRARSEEVAQDAFLLAWQRLPAMDPAPAMPAWVCGVARNLALNAARRRKESAVEHEAVTQQTPLDAMLDREIEALAHAALGTLSAKDREVVTLFYRNESSIAEIAGALGLSEPTVRQRLHRGRERLRSGLAAVEATLRATRPGPAFATACVAALATRGTIAHAAPAPARTMAMKLALGLGVVAVAGVSVLVGTRVLRDEPTRASPRVTAAVARATGASIVVATAAPPTTVPGFRRLAPRERDALRGRIQQARGAISATETAPPPKVYDFSGQSLDAPVVMTPPKPGAPLNKSTLRYAIVAMQPLLQECYAAAFDQLARKDGTLAVVLHLTGEPSVPTMVDAVDVAGDAHFTSDRDLTECVRETLLAIELPPMAERGTVDVYYPFTVSGVAPTKP
jgi:RNA polymerase sigma factor (sigma-70 family)